MGPAGPGRVQAGLHCGIFMVLEVVRTIYSSSDKQAVNGRSVAKERYLQSLYLFTFIYI